MSRLAPTHYIDSKSWPSMNNNVLLFVSDLQTSFACTADPVRAAQQAAYMRNQFSFLGLPKPARALAQRILFKKYAIDNEQDLTEVILSLWNLEHREFQYAALDLAIKYQKLFSPAIIELFQTLIRSKSWWDTVDHIAIKLVGPLARKYPKIALMLNDWVTDDCVWIRRTTLIFQMQWKEATDENVLFGRCHDLMHEKDFFIRKAIGWALRQYSKVKPQSVENFLRLHKSSLSPLSLREASKYLSSNLI